MSADTPTMGTIYGVGVGPGDPDLMSVRAHRLVSSARVIAYFRKKGHSGHARTIIDGIMRPGTLEIAMDYPVTTEIAFDDPGYGEQLRCFYSAAVERLVDIAREGIDIVVLCEGDPFFYGSFMHLHARLKERASVVVVPAITGMSACWTASGIPITYGDDVLSVLPATLPEADLAAHMARADALVIMKIGRNLAKVRRALTACGLVQRAFYVERGSMAGEIVMPLNEKPDDVAPYFAIVLVHGQGRRP
jgi:precorrin-2/cobalt-factor-2 C20-methyltransferase